jgi:hypothetical protein
MISLTGDPLTFPFQARKVAFIIKQGKSRLLSSTESGVYYQAMKKYRLLSVNESGVYNQAMKISFIIRQ